MTRPQQRRFTVVTGLGDNGVPLLEERTIDTLVEVLCRRARRLVRDRALCERLKQASRKFVHNVVDYFHDRGELDEYVMSNIMTALITADSHGPSDHGVEDYSTFIRALNPTDPDAGRYFIIGRAGTINDPACPLNEFTNRGAGLPSMPAAKAHMFQAFHYVRSKDSSRGAPRIPVEDLRRLVPIEVVGGSALENAFLDVCFSDGAWELYELKLAA